MILFLGGGRRWRGFFLMIFWSIRPRRTRNRGRRYDSDAIVQRILHVFLLLRLVFERCRLRLGMNVM